MFYNRFLCLLFSIIGVHRGAKGPWTPQHFKVCFLKLRPLLKYYKFCINIMYLYICPTPSFSNFCSGCASVLNMPFFICCLNFFGILVLFNRPAFQQLFLLFFCYRYIFSTGCRFLI